MLMIEMRNAARRLARRPGYSLLSVAVLGVGLGIALFVFNLVHALILAPLPWPQGDRLVAIGEVRQPGGAADDLGVGINGLDAAQYQVLRHARLGLEALGAYRSVGMVLDQGGQATLQPAGALSASMMDLLGVRPLLGRGFVAADEAQEAAAVVLLGERLWRQAFAADPAIVGRTVRVNGGFATVVGVLPARFGFPGASAAWKPLRLRPGDHAEVFAVARLAPGQSAAALRAALDAEAKPLRDALRSGSRGGRIIAKPLALELVPEDARRWVWLMFGACITVLLLACVNVANLQLVQVLTRRRELALRSALGSHPSRLLCAALLESLLLSLAALIVALPIVLAGNRWLVGLYAAQGQVIGHHVRLDVGPVLVAASLVAALLATLLAGLLPAWRASRVDLQPALRDSGKGSGGFFPRVARALVVVELALTVVLLIGAGTFVRSLDALLEARPVGVTHATEVATAWLALPPARFVDDAERIDLFRRAAARLDHTAGVVAATVANTVPGAVLGSHETVAASGEAMPAEGWLRAQLGIVGPGFLAVYGVRLEAGRFFDGRDDAAHAAVTVVDRAMAERLWPGRDAIGRTIVLWPGQPQAKTLRVVGVIETLQLDDMLNTPRPGFLLPLAQAAGQGPLRGMGVAVRTAGPAARFLPVLARELAAVDGDVAVHGAATQAQAVARGRTGINLLTQVFAVVGLVALLLAAAGLYGVLAFSIAQRTQEIGIRRAIGAGSAAILREVGGQLAWQLALGLGLGAALAIPWTRQLADPNLGTRAVDPAVFGPVLGVMLVVALLAAFVPLRRALGVDPGVALRHD